MELKWGVIIPCINEEQLIRAKIDWALRHNFAVSVVEGHHPAYTKVSPNGLSVDATSEILLSYGNKISYLPVGKVDHEMELRDLALRRLPKDTQMVIMSDVDEFWSDEDLEKFDEMFRKDPYLKVLACNSLIFLDEVGCAEHIKRKESAPFPFEPQVDMCYGEYHERIYRYNPYLGYNRSPFLVNDIMGRFLFSDPVYYGERKLLKDVYMLHYKNFKMAEQTERLKMYDGYNDGVKHDKEWQILRDNEFIFEGSHPKEIQELMEVKNEKKR